MQYYIGEFARITNLSVDTLRYYEQEKLIQPKRNAANRRCYSEDDLAWIEFIKRLKATGMPLKQIRRYAELRAVGAITIPERLAMLQAHRAALSDQIRQLQQHLAKLDKKIDFYQKKIETA